LTVLVAVVAVAGPAVAQESTSYKLHEHAFNAGGHPAGGTTPASASYRMTLDAIGEACLGPGSGSASYRMDASLAAAYPPPGEVRGLRFSDEQTLLWDPEESVGSYTLYRGLISDLAGREYGLCTQPGLTEETATDAGDPPLDDGYFFLVTARNRLAEEGTKGADSDDEQRAASACP
jgi:hypothetical protein